MKRILYLLFLVAPLNILAETNHPDFYICSNGWKVKVGDTLVFSKPPGDSMESVYTKTPWIKGKEKPHELPSSYGNRKVVITDIERSCYKENCFIAVHFKSDMIDDAVCYIEDIVKRNNGKSGLIIPSFKPYNTCPIKIEKFSISRNSIGSPVVTIRFTNVGNEAVEGIKFAISCYNSLGEDVNVGVNGNTYYGTYQEDINPNKTRSKDFTLYLYEEASRFSVSVDKVKLQGYFGKTWERKEHIMEREVE